MVIKCKICNKEFYIRPSHYKRNKNHCCSYKCNGILYTKLYSKPNLICLICGKEYKPKSYKTTKFCSIKCFAKDKSIKQSEVKNCVICGREIRVVNALCLPENTCGIDCKNRLHSQRMTASGNPNWRDGIGKLPWGYEFTTLLKYKIKRRDNFRCRLCGIKSKDLPKKKGYGLSCHHIDYNKHNNKEDNLITLCNTCHGKTHYNRKKWKKELSKMLK